MNVEIGRICRLEQSKVMQSAFSSAKWIAATEPGPSSGNSIGLRDDIGIGHDWHLVRERDVFARFLY
jgi:hypothetical protein